MPGIDPQRPDPAEAVAVETVAAETGGPAIERILDLSRKGPVIITRADRPVALVTAHDDGLGRLDRSLLGATAPGPRRRLDMRLFIGCTRTAEAARKALDSILAAERP